jgi:hypothetical protein
LESVTRIAPALLPLMLFQSKRKGLSADEKYAKLKELFHEMVSVLPISPIKFTFTCLAVYCYKRTV